MEFYIHHINNISISIETFHSGVGVICQILSVPYRYQSVRPCRSFTARKKNLKAKLEPLGKICLTFRATLMT